MTRKRVALSLFAACACFGAGVAAAQIFGVGAPPAPTLSSPPAPIVSSPPALSPGDGGLPAELQLDASEKAPKILFDPDAIELLPDASLELKLPPGFDAGER